MSDQIVDDPGIVIPPRDCDAVMALDTAVQLARRAVQLTIAHNPTARNHASTAAAWAQIGIALLVRDGATVPTAARTGEDW